MAVNKQRKVPIQLEHVKAHEKLMERLSVGNATADLMADQARLFGENSPLPLHKCDYEYTFFGKSGGPNNLKAMKSYLNDKEREASLGKAKWPESSQANFAVRHCFFESFDFIGPHRRAPHKEFS